MRRHLSGAGRLSVRVLLIALPLSPVLGPARPGHAAEIRLGVEVEFRTWFRPETAPHSSFQLRESKLFLDTFISPRSSALLEFAMKMEDEAPRVERGFFLWRSDFLGTRLKFGQLRIPFGNWDAFTIDRSLSKNIPVGGDDPRFSGFKLRRLDVGVEVESRVKALTAVVAVLNGGTVDELDDNDRKDVVGQLGLDLGHFTVHANGYTGRQGGAEPGGGPVDRRVQALGVDVLYFRGPLTLGGEAVLRMDVGDVRASGGYGQFVYDLIDLLYGLRLVGKVEYWDPDTRREGDDVVETIVGFKQTLARGMTLQVEYQEFSRQSERFQDGVLLEIELEL